MDFCDLVKVRRSHRAFLGDEVPKESLRLILRSALMAPTSKCRRDWRFLVVGNREALREMSQAKESGASFLADAPLAIVVVGSPERNDCWIEDCSIAAITMQYQAEDLGLGACWVQFRGRGTGDGKSADSHLRVLLHLEEGEEVLCAVAIGGKASQRPPQNEDKLLWGSVGYVD